MSNTVELRAEQEAAQKKALLDSCEMELNKCEMDLKEREMS